MKAHDDAGGSVSRRRIDVRRRVWATGALTFLGLAFLGLSACRGGIGTFLDGDGTSAPPGPLDLAYRDEGTAGGSQTIVCPPDSRQTLDGDPCSPTSSRIAGQGPTLGSARDASVELGAYGGDPRLAHVVDEWPVLVGDAMDRLSLVAGLAFPAESAPRVVLAPLGDERQAWALETEMFEGYRRTVVRVNAEVLATGRRRVTAVLPAALAAAVYEDLALRREAPEPWLVLAASIVAGGDLDRRLVELKRSAEDEGPTGIRVDPLDPSVAEATAVGAILVLTRSADPENLRRFLRFTADGDDPHDYLTQDIRDPTGRWSGAARSLLDERLDGVDVEPWARLRAARRALVEEGRGGMELALGDDVPGEIAVEVRVLRVRALLDEGRYDEGRRLLDEADPGAAARLDEPWEAALLRVRAEEGPGGDRRRAEALARQTALDYPRAWRAAGRDGGRTPARGPAGGGTPSEPALTEVARTLHVLLDDHRAGAARRVLEELGERALAPELEPLCRAVAEEEAHPSPEGRAANGPRVAAWLSNPTEATATDVREGGGAAAEVLAQRLPAGGPQRAPALRLLVEAGGAGRAARSLAPGWRRAPGLFAGDVNALLTVVPYTELRVWVGGVASDVVARAGGERFWERARLGVDAEWLRGHGDVLRDFASEDYARRREAFLTLVAEDQATPDVVARGLQDPAPLLRREAVHAAGRQGFDSLVEYALKEDEAWLVRQAACSAAAVALGPRAPAALLAVFRDDPVPQVRQAAVRALLPLAAQDACLVAPLVDGLRTGDPLVRDELTTGLPSLPREEMSAALYRALEAATRTPDMDVPHVSRLFLVLRRVLGGDPGYYPGLSHVEVRTLVAEVGRTLQAGAEARRMGGTR